MESRLRTGAPTGLEGLDEGPAVVALGGGHGLAATLRAVRRMTNSVTAVVGVSDDGGSSGRLRREFGLVPPGDLRMALAALCGDDTWGRTWSRVLQHRFSGDGALAGHAVGNLLISALWQETEDIVTGLDWVAALLGAQGRVLPVALEPVDLVAEVLGHEPSAPSEITTVRGQVAIATTPGDVLSLRIEPEHPEPCPQTLAALAAAEMIVMGPGSWFTSVLPHLQVPQVREAINASSATKVLVLNLAEQRGETSGFTTNRYVEHLAHTFPEMKLDHVVADPHTVTDPVSFQRACAHVGAQAVVAPVASRSGAVIRPVHDTLLLASVFAGVMNP